MRRLRVSGASTDTQLPKGPRDTGQTVIALSLFESTAVQFGCIVCHNTDLFTAHGGGGGGRDALEGKGPQRRPQRRLGRRLEEIAKAVGGGYCRLQMPLKPALGVRGTVAGRRLGALEGVPPDLPMHPCWGWGGVFGKGKAEQTPTQVKIKQSALQTTEAAVLQTYGTNVRKQTARSQNCGNDTDCGPDKGVLHR